MSNELEPTHPAETLVYEIRIMGQLNSRWSEWFEGLTVTGQENGDTLITGPIVDQAALYAVLRQVRDLGMPLLSLNRVLPATTGTQNAKE